MIGITQKWEKKENGTEETEYYEAIWDPAKGPPQLNLPGSIYPSVYDSLIINL
ncbi:MAG: hypothetical protein Ct9H300mP2_1930 [Candidatus Neomarinimicrobiota bacterium]|nr:MAG: hypothetical protein Ct9H300mP2_1930 [Candidatus Neomarinimicrobiota bacterium]